MICDDIPACLPWARRVRRGVMVSVCGQCTMNAVQTNVPSFLLVSSHFIEELGNAISPETFMRSLFQVFISAGEDKFPYNLYKWFHYCILWHDDSPHNVINSTLEIE